MISLVHFPTLKPRPLIQVFYAVCNSSITLWLLVAGEIRFPWVRYEVGSMTEVRDAALCHAMAKMFAATSKGILIVYKVTQQDLNR